MQAAVRHSVGILFAIAAVGVLGWNLHLDHLWNGLALTLLCIDQGRMALVDLDNIRQVTLADQRVRQFHRVTLITIAIQLIGFYLAWIYLGFGTALVLISQLFFNTAAKIQLYPDRLDPIQSVGLHERSPVLLANAIALGLIALWQLGQFRQITAALLLVMVLGYLGIKYLATSPDTATDGDESIKHPPG